MNNWLPVAQRLFDQIAPISGVKQRIIETIYEKGSYFLDIGPQSQGELGFAYYESYDGSDKPNCRPGEVYLSHFKEAAIVNVAEFERFVAGWPWVRG